MDNTGKKKTGTKNRKKKQEKKHESVFIILNSVRANNYKCMIAV